MFFRSLHDAKMGFCRKAFVLVCASMTVHSAEIRIYLPCNNSCIPPPWSELLSCEPAVPGNLSPGAIQFVTAAGEHVSTDAN